MPGKHSTSLSDFVTHAVAVGLAAACLAFAGYKVLLLRGMDNPPPDMGLNFPPPKRKIITDDAIRVDSLVTGSVGAAGRTDAAASSRPLQPYSDESPVRDFRLVTVINGIAFVELRTLRGKEMKPLTEGSYLPGAGPVSRIVRVNGGWRLVAGSLTLEARDQ